MGRMGPIGPMSLMGLWVTSIAPDPQISLRNLIASLAENSEETERSSNA
jgi:hypothetical protein